MEDNSCATAHTVRSSPCFGREVAAAFFAHIHKNNFILTMVWRERRIERLCVPSGVLFTLLGDTHMACVVRSPRPLEEI
jgi:hypothetical protein